MHQFSRREFAGALIGGALAGIAEAAPTPVIIDTHTHFYDTSRPQGVDWPGKDDKILYRPVMPSEFVKLAQPHGVTGTVVVEASPRVEDNHWLLELAEKNPVIVGVVGRLDPRDAKFDDQLKRLSKQSLYRGFRINHPELAMVLKEQAALKRLHRMIDLGLTLDVNGGPEGLPTLLEAAKKLPKLRIVLNHNGNVRIDGKIIPAEWKSNILKVGDQANVSCKMSAMVEGSGVKDGKAPTNLEHYQGTLDTVWEAFGENRLMFGSDWPVSSIFATYADVFKLADTYLKTKSKAAKTKVMGDNAMTIYGLKSGT